MIVLTIYQVKSILVLMLRNSGVSKKGDSAVCVKQFISSSYHSSQ